MEDKHLNVVFCKSLFDIEVYNEIICLLSYQDWYKSGNNDVNKSFLRYGSWKLLTLCTETNRQTQ